MRGLLLGIRKWPLGIRLLLGAITTAVPFYVAAYLRFSVAQVAQLGHPLTLALHGAIFIVLVTAVVFVARYVSAVYARVEEEEQAQIAMRLHAYAHLDRLISKEIRHLHRDWGTSSFIERFVASTESLQELVEAAYSSIEAAYGKSARTTDRVDFEVTFMTRSYRDKFITIPASANRDGRAPRSMILRQSNPDLYETTITALIYREARPGIHIVEDTNDPKESYRELYPDQTKRIRSSVIFPVLSDSNELLGTLVVHCDRSGFFKRTDEKYWTDVLEVFSKRIALVKLKLDMLVADGEKGGAISLSMEPPF